MNDAVAYIRGLAELRNRNADWAERAVREAASLSSTAAARENVIDFIATTVEDLLAQANGRTVRVGQNGCPARYHRSCRRGTSSRIGGPVCFR